MDVRNTALKALGLLVDKKLHYLNEFSPQNLIFQAPQWSFNQGEYRDSLLWEDIIYSKDENLAIVSKGSIIKDYYTLGESLT